MKKLKILKIVSRLSVNSSHAQKTDTSGSRNMRLRISVRIFDRLKIHAIRCSVSSIGDGVTSALLDGANSLPIVLFKKWGKSLGIKMEFF